ncbi:hypothetical protein M513_13263 [Trichuris suis]|uniref:Uncharacterized protein n=1 Tax=Trichuris suis TaxID=68888 RepID=A0A085LLK4_9BILA|nr:hypothetical protein M513_13263 [Trichuris suis]
MEALKTQVRDTANAPCQIIQACNTSAAAEIAPCLPSANALRCIIRRVRKCHQYVEARTLAEVHVPEELQRTLDGETYFWQKTQSSVKIVFFSSLPELTWTSSHTHPCG